MGQDKSFIQLAGRPLIEHILEKVSELGDELMIVSNSLETYDLAGVRIISDEVPGQGALQGLDTALSYARFERVLLLACDMPFLSRPLLEHLIRLDPQADLVVPVRGGMYEPMPAVYAKRCLPSIHKALEVGEKRMTSFYGSIRVHPVYESELRLYDPEGLSFFNINTPQELEQAERIYAKRLETGE